MSKERIAAIRAVCPGIDPTSIVKYLTFNYCDERAKADWQKELLFRQKTTTQRNVHSSLGVEPLPEVTTVTGNRVHNGSARDEFKQLVQEQVSKGQDRSRAVARVRRENPELVRQMLQEANALRN